VTDGELVKRVRGGDRQAFGALVDRYRDMVYGLGYHLTGDFESARDLAQDAFVQAYLKLDTLRQPDRFAGWLRRIAVNAHRMEARRQRVATVALEEDAHAAAPDRSPSEIEVVVREALGRLRPPERLALTLHYINGYSHAEIGQFLGVGSDVVKARLARARQRLRREVANMVEDTFGSKKLPDEFTDETVAEALRRGRAALDEADWQSALEAFGEVIALRPESVQARTGLGAAWDMRYCQVSDPQALAKAKAEFEKALQLDPRNEDALIFLANTDPGDKCEAYRRALAVLPESVWLRYSLAWATGDAGDVEQAVRMMTAMLDGDLPASVRATIHNNLGSWLHDTLGDPGRGRQHLRLAAEAAETAGSVPSASPFFHWRVYAWAALKDRQWHDALDAAMHIIAAAPTDLERRSLHNLAAAALANLGRREEALDHLEQAAKPLPDPPNAERWPYRPSAPYDPLDWVRENAADYFAPIAQDPRFGRLLGEPA
jgi:RNA polymerase sigma factor (sigma-70 family)